MGRRVAGRLRRAYTQIAAGVNRVHRSKGQIGD